jgi:hypothetical protein
MYCLCVNVYCTVLYCTVLYCTVLLSSGGKPIPVKYITHPNISLGVRVYGFCNVCVCVWVCMYWFCNVWVCVCVGVYVLVL